MVFSAFSASSAVRNYEKWLRSHHWKTQRGEIYIDECVSGGAAVYCDAEAADHAESGVGDYEQRAVSGYFLGYAGDVGAEGTASGGDE